MLVFIIFFFFSPKFERVLESELMVCATRKFHAYMSSYGLPCLYGNVCGSKMEPGLGRERAKESFTSSRSSLAEERPGCLARHHPGQ